MVFERGDLQDWYRVDLELGAMRKRISKKPGIVEELLSDLDEPLTIEQHPSVDSYLNARLDTAQRGVDQIHREIHARRQMTQGFLEQLDSAIHYVTVSLDKFSGWGVGYNTGVDVKRNHLERQLQQLRAERRSTEQQAWGDLVRLRKELREAVAEYRGARRLAGVASGS